MATNRLYAETNTTMPNMDVIPGGGRTGAQAKSGDPVVVGQVPGVLAGDADALGTGVIFRDGIFNLYVKGDNGSPAAIAEGAIVYFTPGDTPGLSSKTSGVRFGYALKGVASGTIQLIPVQLGY